MKLHYIPVGAVRKLPTPALLALQTRKAAQTLPLLPVFSIPQSLPGR